MKEGEIFNAIGRGERVFAQVIRHKNEPPELRWVSFSIREPLEGANEETIWLSNDLRTEVDLFEIKIVPVGKFIPPAAYQDYIRSATWKTRAFAAKERADWKCQVCNRSRREVVLDAHHRTYERLGRELPEDITVLCRDCHSLYELNKNHKESEEANV